MTKSISSIELSKENTKTKNDNYDDIQLTVCFIKLKLIWLSLIEQVVVKIKMEYINWLNHLTQSKSASRRERTKVTKKAGHGKGKAKI